MVSPFKRKEKIIELRPIKETVSDYDDIEAEIKRVFREEIYLPILRELEGKKSVALQNAAFSLAEAIRLGRIQYSRGSFVGKFNASISKELKELGAVWDRKTSSFKIQKAALPLDLRGAIDASSIRFAEKIAGIDRRLGKILPEQISDKIQVGKLFDAAIWKVERNFQDTIRNITIAPELSKADRKRISDEWQKNMELWVQDFTKKEILELRDKIQKSVFTGNRYESAVSTIQKSYDVSSRKAKFLARQETNLLMTKYKQVRYEAAGVTEYFWMCVAGSAKHPVRPRHKALADASKAGKIFKWNDPPVTSEPGEPQRRNNPGQDYNCRCSAKPIVRFREGNK